MKYTLNCDDSTTFMAAWSIMTSSSCLDVLQTAKGLVVNFMDSEMKI